MNFMMRMLITHLSCWHRWDKGWIATIHCNWILVFLEAFQKKLKKRWWSWKICGKT